MTDLTGRKFGRWTALELSHVERKGKNYHYYWRCRCECGNERIVDKSSLVNGKSQSCGCLSKERQAETHRRHGQSGTPIYRVWCAMKQRCFDVNCKGYPHYGGRGITVCDEWQDFQAFFDHVSRLEHFGEAGCSLDRIDNAGNYEPGNVRWASKSEQARNRRGNTLVEYQGEQMTLTEAAQLNGLKAGTLLYRFRKGDALETLFRPLRHFLTADERREIKRTFKKGDRRFGERALARKFGVAPRTIHKIINE